MASRKYWPIAQLTVSRLREFVRQPAAVFWVYGFPILMMLSLGMAFRENVTEDIRVDLVGGREPIVGSAVSTGPSASTIEEALTADSKFKVISQPREDWRKRLQAGKTDLVIEIGSDGQYQMWDEPHRAESETARYAVEAELLRRQIHWQTNADRQTGLARGESVISVPDVKHLQAPGSRYIDFLLPGMIGLGLMGGGLWGVGFVIVDMRIRKLLKRFLATPMRRSDFLLAIMFSRLIFTLGDIVVLLLFGWLVFHTRVAGSYLELTAVIALGAAAFAGIGMLVASRAQTLETVSGLMNLVMLPMWVFSGVFFSSERFPEVTQPIINLLPLTALNQLLRGIMLEGDSILRFWPQVIILAGYTVITFAIALRIFRWR